MERKKRYSHYCLRCGYVWISGLETPARCASCRSQYWNIKKKESSQGQKGLTNQSEAATVVH